MLNALCDIESITDIGIEDNDSAITGLLQGFSIVESRDPVPGGLKVFGCLNPTN